MEASHLSTSKDQLERFTRVAQNLRLNVPDTTTESTQETIEDVRAQLNAQIYPKSEPWMVPRWVARVHGKIEENIADSRFRNDRNRDWAVVGSVGARNYASIDSAGLVCSLPQCGSIDVWIKDADEIVFPALADRSGPELSLVSPADQVFEWSASTGPISFTRLIYHATQGEKEAIYNEVFIQNRALEDVAFTFYVALRPMSALGVEPIEDIEYISSTRELYSNGLLALVVEESPSSTIMDTADNSVLFSSDIRTDTQFDAPTGMGSAVLRYDVKLGPAGSKRLFFISPLDPLSKYDEKPNYPAKTSVRDNSVAKWYDFSDMSPAGTFPDRYIDDTMVQVRASQAIMADKALTADDTGYSWSDRARILLAMCQSNCVELAEEKAIKIANQIQVDEYDFSLKKFSPLLWGILQTYCYSKNVSFLRMIRPFLNKVVSGINANLPTKPDEEVEVEEPPSEELVVPEIVELDEEGTTDDMIDEDEESTGIPLVEEPTPPLPPPPPEPWSLEEVATGIWTLAALRAAHYAYEELRDVTSVKGTEAIIADYEITLKEHCLETLSGSDNSNLEEYVTTEDGVKTILDILFGVCWFDVPEVTDKDVSVLLNALLDTNLKDGLICLPGTPRKCSGHLAMRLALYQSIYGSRFDIEKLLKRSLEFVTEFNVFPEWVNIQTSGGRDGEGCSILAAADFLILLRNMIIFEKKKELILLRGIPDEWFTSGVALSLSDLVTRNGRISIDVGTSTNQHQIEVNMTRLPEEIQVHLPIYIPIPMVKVYGAGITDKFKDPETSYIEVIPLTNEVVIAFHK
ncbi:MAG: hypothetical protein RTU30_02865 [Candidatus Thorarchaeota archaeon]